MTRKEAIEILKEIEYPANGDNKEYRDMAFDMAIKALKQEPVLDRIRAEIIELRSKQNVGVLECLDILDKYRVESEVQE